MVQLSATRCSYIAILWVSIVSFAAITLCVDSQRAFIVVSVYFVMTQSGNFWMLPRMEIILRENCEENVGMTSRHEGVLGSGGIAPRILDLGTRWKWVVSFTPRPLYPRERAPVIHWIGGWVDTRVGMDMVLKRKIPNSRTYKIDCTCRRT
jgi:hypothetical protein